MTAAAGGGARPGKPSAGMPGFWRTLKKAEAAIPQPLPLRSQIPGGLQAPDVTRKARDLPETATETLLCRGGGVEAAQMQLIKQLQPLPCRFPICNNTVKIRKLRNFHK